MIIEVTKVFRVNINERTKAFKKCKTEAEIHELIEQEIEKEESYGSSVVVESIKYRQLNRLEVIKVRNDIARAK